MSFWPSLAVEGIGGVVTAAALALVAGLYGGSALIRRHDAQVDDLREDNPALVPRSSPPARHRDVADRR